MLKTIFSSFLGSGMKPLVRSAIWYNRNLDCNIVYEKIVPSKKDPTRTTKAPVHSLRPCKELGKDLYSEKMDVEDVITLFNKVKDRKPTGLGLLCNLSSKNLLFLDFDDWQKVWRTKEEGMKWFANYGYITYETPRGFRVLIILDEHTRRFGDIEIISKDGEHIGEGGGVRSSHKWTMPPSHVLGRDIFYTFVDEEGNRFKYPWQIKRFTRVMWADALLEKLEEELGIKLVQSGRSIPIGKKYSEEEAVDNPRCNIQLLNKMTDKQLIAFLVLVFRKVSKKAGRKCALADIFMEWYRTGTIPIKKYYGGLYKTGDPYRGRKEITITFRMLMINTIAGVLRDFGTNLERISEFLANSYRDLDGTPDDSVRKVIYAIERGRYDLTMKGECPWCSVYSLRKPCSERPLSMARRASCEEAERLAMAVVERIA